MRAKTLLPQLPARGRSVSEYYLLSRGQRLNKIVLCILKVSNYVLANRPWILVLYKEIKGEKNHLQRAVNDSFEVKLILS